MKHKKYVDFIIILCTLAGITFNTFGQELNIKSGIYGFFDNREYFNYYSNDQTIFGARAYAQAGISINQKNEFVFGLDGLYEFGSNLNSDYLCPIIYIHNSNNIVDLYLGSFYRNPIVHIPDVLLNDTIQYYRPNMEGIYINYRKKYFSHNIWIDWTSRQTELDKEIFVLGGSGSVSLKNFFYRHDFVFTHYALTSNLNTNEHIRDNGGIYARIGAYSTGLFLFDSLTISTGIVFSYDRTRNITPLRYNKGSITELSAQYKTIGIKYTFYYGDGQTIITGDPLYKAKNYSRLDFIWKIFNRPGIEGEFDVSFHFINDYVDYSQKFTLRAELDYQKNLNPEKIKNSTL